MMENKHRGGHHVLLLIANTFCGGDVIPKSKEDEKGKNDPRKSSKSTKSDKNRQKLPKRPPSK
jgi:hypothetical protein